nr:ORF87 [Acipenserid herpesvirus 1]
MWVLLLSMSMLLMPCFYATCDSDYYSHDDKCCQKCSPGSSVLKHCEVDQGPSDCKPCRSGTYMDLANGLDNCFRCKTCDEYFNFTTVQPCTNTTNTVCQCKPNHVCNNENCEFCQKPRSKKKQKCCACPVDQ